MDVRIDLSLGEERSEYRNDGFEHLGVASYYTEHRGVLPPAVFPVGKQLVNVGIRAFPLSYRRDSRWH